MPTIFATLFARFAHTSFLRYFYTDMLIFSPPIFAAYAAIYAAFFAAYFAATPFHCVYFLSPPLSFLFDCCRLLFTIAAFAALR